MWSSISVKTLPVPYLQVLACRDVTAHIESPEYSGPERRSPFTITHHNGRNWPDVGTGKFLCYYPIPPIPDHEWKQDQFWLPASVHPMSDRLLLIYYGLRQSVSLDRINFGVSPGLYIARATRQGNMLGWTLQQPRVVGGHGWLPVPAIGVWAWSELPEYA